MKSRRNFLRHLIKEKHLFIKQETVLFDYFNDDDWEWFNSLSKEDIFLIYNIIMFNFYVDCEYIADLSWCLQCIYTDEMNIDCDKCPYKKSHMNIACGDENSTYDYIIRSFDGESITDTVGEENVINFIKWNVV